MARWRTLLLVMALPACAQMQASAPSTALPDLPEQFAAGERDAGEIAGRWWDDLGDPQLARLVERALQGNPSIDAAAARLRQARAVARIDRADLLPAISADLGAAETGGGSAIVDRGIYDLGVTASWEVDLWGRLSARSAAARTDALASEADLEAIRQLVAAETARTYLAVVEAQAQLNLSESVLATYDELIRQLDLRVDAGVTPRSFAALAATDRESARAGLEARREDYARLVRRLEVLLGDYPAGSLETASLLPDLSPLPDTGVPAQLVERRPDLQAAALAVTAADYRIAAAEADFLPGIRLTGSAGSSAGDFADLFDSAFGVWSIAGRLLQPIFEGGRLRARLDLREGERDEAIATYADAVLQAMFEVESALAVENSLAEREAAFDRSASAAEEATRISVLRYEAGIESFFNVLEAQQRALFARSSFISARRARLANRIDLHLALGGDIAESGEPAPY